MPLHPLQAEWDADIGGRDPLEFPGYTPPAEESVRAGVARATTERGSADYVVIEGRFDVMGGSMGLAAGEKVVRAYDRAVDLRLPVVVVASSGGARMQEGMLALVQMARTAAAARRHARAGMLSAAVFRIAATGGVLASYGSLTDLRAAERDAVIGFAGPRVVELTTAEPLLRESHTAESAFAYGLVDALLDNDGAPRWVETVLGLRERPLAPRHLSAPTALTEAGAWGEVLRARVPGRPTGIDWAASLCSSWLELRGTDDVVRAGLATIAGRRAVVVATDRYERDGRPGPAAFRTAQRAIALADRIGLPLVALVDTPGADPRPESDRAGVATEIASTLAAMAELRTISVAVCVGEGGSGGALALAHCDRLLMQEHAIFSVIGPEGAAAILDRDVAGAAARAEHLRLTAGDLVDLGVADAVVAEDAEAMRRAIGHGLDAATAGDRARRVDSATARWLRP